MKAWRSARSGGAAGEGQLRRHRTRGADRPDTSRERPSTAPGPETGTSTRPAIHRERSSGQRPAGDEAMQVQMLREILSPVCSIAVIADRAAEVPRISPEGEQRVGRRAEQQRVDHARIALREGVERVRQGEDDVEVRNRQQVGLARRQPPFLGERLTLRAMAIATGVVGDRAWRRSGHTSPDARRARPCGSARSPAARTTWTWRAGACADTRRPYARTMSASSSRGARSEAAVPRGVTAHTGQPRRREVEPVIPVARPGVVNAACVRLPVACRRRDRLVAEQPLNRVQVDPGFEQMRREGVPQRVDAPRLGDPRPTLRQGVRALEPGRIQRPGCVLARKQPRRRTSDSPVGTERVEQPRRQHRVAVLPALALLDPNRHPRRVDVVHAEMEHLVEPQAARVGRHQHRAMLLIGWPARSAAGLPHGSGGPATCPAAAGTEWRTSSGHGSTSRGRGTAAHARRCCRCSTSAGGHESDTAGTPESPSSVIRSGDRR